MKSSLSTSLFPCFAAIALSKEDLPVERPPTMVFKFGLRRIVPCQKPYSSNFTLSITLYMFFSSGFVD